MSVRFVVIIIVGGLVAIAHAYTVFLRQFPVGAYRVSHLLHILSVTQFHRGKRVNLTLL